MLVRTSQALAVGAVGFPNLSFGAAAKRTLSAGSIVGDVGGARTGREVLASGGNPIDAAVTAALVSCIVSPSHCGIGGYGGHMTICMAGHRPVSIDYNSLAPAEATPEMFWDNQAGRAKEQIYLAGWLSAGVPGVLAGMEYALKHYGTRSFRDVLQPAIKLARDGMVIDHVCAEGISVSASLLAKDPASAKLYFHNGQPFKEGEVLRNPELAEMLETLAKRNSADSFYRGDIAQRIADGFKRNGGLVTTKDLAAYHARKVTPLEVSAKGSRVYTAPLTAGGLSALEILAVLRAMEWTGQGDSPEKTHSRLEAMRLVWKDRVELLGDPEKANVPVKRLLSEEHASEFAGIANAAAKGGRPAEIQINPETGSGTTNISCADGHGNVVAMTLTHGADFGAKVSVEGLGLTLGHGMRKFNPYPGHPNAPGPWKRPVHNMCPSVVLWENGRATAVGGAGGVRIPNAVTDFLITHVLENRSITEAMAAPRMNTNGDLNVMLESSWPAADAEYLGKVGFKITRGRGAHLSAVSFDGKTGECSSAER